MMRKRQVRFLGEGRGAIPKPYPTELTPKQFEASPQTARNILVCVMRDVLKDEYKASGNNETLAVRRAASWWMTGDPNQYNSAAIASYTDKVLQFYQQQRSKTPSQPNKPTGAGVR